MLVELSAWWVRPPARRTWQTTGKVSGNHPHTAHESADTVRIKFMHNVRTSSTIWNSYLSSTRQQISRYVKQPVVLSGFHITYLSCEKVPQPEMCCSKFVTQIKGHKKKLQKMFVHGFATPVRKNSKNIKWFPWIVALRNFACTFQCNTICIKIWQTRLQTSCKDLNLTSAVKYQSEERRSPFNPMIKILGYQAVVKQLSRKVSPA
jgi:hypothetical protein